MTAEPFNELLIMPSPDMPAEMRQRFARGGYRMTFLKPGDPYDVNLSVLGTTPDQPAVRITVESPLGWHGYTFVLFGTYERPDSPAAAPRFSLGGPAGAAIAWVPLIAWQRQVRLPATPLYVEACWSPLEGATLALKGLEREKRLSYVKRAHAAIKLLDAMQGPGRALGSLAMDQATFRQRYPTVYQEQWDAFRSRPRQYEVAAALSIDPDTLRYYLRLYQLPFPPAKKIFEWGN